MVPIVACVRRVRRSKQRLMSTNEQFSILILGLMVHANRQQFRMSSRSLEATHRIISELPGSFLQNRIITEKRKPELIRRPTGASISTRTNGSPYYHMTEFSLRTEAASHIRLLRTKFVSHLPRTRFTYLSTLFLRRVLLYLSRPLYPIHPSSHPFIRPSGSSVRLSVRPAIRVLVGAVKSHECNYQPRKQATR